MPSEITTRRAIEVCLSRIPMHASMRDAMLRNLQVAIRKGEQGADAPDCDRAAVAAVLSEMESLNDTFPKKVLLGRLRGCKATLRRILETGQ